MVALLCALLLPRTVQGNMYDVVLPRYQTQCLHGCLAWPDVPDFVDPGMKNTSKVKVGSLFADGSVPAGIGDSCAMPAAHAGDHECDCGQKPGEEEEYTLDSYQGPWCFCKPGPDGSLPNVTAYCDPPNGTASYPEQINLQVAASDVLVVGFVTYEKVLPAASPQAMFGKKGGTMQAVSGVSHFYTPPGRPYDQYVMSYIKFPTEPRTEYSYKVKSGGAACEWSEEFTFRSLYQDGPTNVLTVSNWTLWLAQGRHILQRVAPRTAVRGHGPLSLQLHGQHDR